MFSLLRRYLEKRFQQPARRQTTREFIASLAEQPALAEERPWLEAFLTRCDILKFAPVDAAAEECKQLARDVREFLGRWTARDKCGGLTSQAARAAP